MFFSYLEIILAAIGCMSNGVWCSSNELHVYATIDRMNFTTKLCSNSHYSHWLQILLNPIILMTFEFVLPNILPFFSFGSLPLRFIWLKAVSVYMYNMNMRHVCCVPIRRSYFIEIDFSVNFCSCFIIVRILPISLATCYRQIITVDLFTLQIQRKSNCVKSTNTENNEFQ